MTTKRTAKRPAKKATKKAARKAAAVTIPSPVEVLGEVGATLNDRERRFAYAYAADPNASKAYRSISPDVTSETARSEGMLMKRRPAVAELIVTLQAEILAKYNVTNESIVEGYSLIARFDPADMYDGTGNLLAVHEMPEHVRRALAVEIDGTTVKVKSVARREALQDLAKIRKMLTDRVEHDVSENLADLLAGARQRANSR